MQVMCLNGWGGKLHDFLLPYLRQSDPDVLCLQEVIHTPKADKDWLTYRDGDHILPQRARFFVEVADALPEHQAMFCPAAQGALWDADRPIPSQWGLATFVRNDIPIIAQRQGFVHKSYSPTGFGDHPRSRNGHALRLHDHARDRGLSLVHMHGLRDLAGKIDTPARRDQALHLAALLQSVSAAGDLRAVCGDFNVKPDSETLQILAADGFAELVQAYGFPGTRNSHYTKPERFADYMLVSDPAAVQGFEVVYSPEVSDHCPLILSV